MCSGATRGVRSRQGHSGGLAARDFSCFAWPRTAFWRWLARTRVGLIRAEKLAAAILRGYGAGRVRVVNSVSTGGTTQLNCAGQPESVAAFRQRVCDAVAI